MSRAPRKRRATDCCFFVELLDRDGVERRVAVGNFWASSPEEACQMAEALYSGLTSSMETHAWRWHASQIADAAKPLPVDRKLKALNPEK